LKYLIAGLGNPGHDYINTRHNIGFEILDSLADSSGIEFRDKRYAFISEYKYKSRIFILIKPTTFVNLSGRAVNYWLQKKKIPVSNLLVISDDINLPFGTIRIRPGGGDGGHNGLRSIIEILGNNNFARLRFGIGDDFMPGNQVDYVLGQWTETEKKVLPEYINKCIEASKSFGTVGLELTMNNFNS